MEEKVIKLDRSKASYEAAAHFFAVLAYPEPQAIKERQLLWKAIGVWALMEGASRDENWALQHQWVRPSLLQGIDDHRSILRRGAKRLHERLAAAYYIVAPQLEDLSEMEGELTTVTNMARLAGGFVGWKGVDSSATAKNKIWKPTKPVVHLALGWIRFVKEFRALADDEKHDPFLTFFFEESCLKSVLGHAEVYRDQIPKIKRFKLPKDDLIAVI